MAKRLFALHASLFALGCVLFIPFPFYLLNIQSATTDFIFGKLIGFVARNVFSIALKDTHVYSDSVSMYILVLLLFIFTFIIALLLYRSKIWLRHEQRLIAFFYQLFVYYLALQLLKYGVDKIFKNQFYLPEPNTLFTPVGNISKDLLYWSAMGSSSFYSIFLGVIEVLTALLIFFRKTRLIGLLMSSMILLNVIAVNFGFDISVKLYSLFLFFLTVYLLVPYASWLWRIVKVKKFIVFPFQRTNLFPNRFISGFVKIFIAGLILLEVLFPFIKANNFNGDSTARPYLHGAYEVQQMISGNDTLSIPDFPLKRFFIHSSGYMIFQDQQGTMQDFKLNYDTANGKLILTDYELKKTTFSFAYNAVDSVLTMRYFNNGTKTQLEGKAIDWKQMPLLKKGFHWMVDGE